MAACLAVATVACVARPPVRVTEAPDRPIGPQAACPLDEAARRLDEWHDAAARSQLEEYLSVLSSDARFLGTDASERWTKAELRSCAADPFAEGRGWVMRAIRRDVFTAEGKADAQRRLRHGELVWFDEDLDTANLGPARGSGVLRCRDDGRFELVHYVLSVTVPNDRFESVRDLLATP
jgi:hypothetical protein